MQNCPRVVICQNRVSSTMMRKKSAGPEQIVESTTSVDWEIVQGRPLHENDVPATDTSDQEPAYHVESSPETSAAFTFEPKKFDLLPNATILICVALISWGIGCLVGQASSSSSQAITQQISDNYRNHLVACSKRANENEVGLVQIRNELEEMSTLLESGIQEFIFQAPNGGEATEKGNSYVSESGSYHDEIAAALAVVARAKTQAASLIQASKKDVSFRLKSDRFAKQHKETKKKLMSCERSLNEAMDVLDDFTAARKELEDNANELFELTEAQRETIGKLTEELETLTASFSPAPAPEVLYFSGGAMDFANHDSRGSSHSGRSYTLNQAYLRGYHDASWWDHTTEDENGFREKCLRVMAKEDEGIQGVTSAEAFAIEEEAYHNGFEAGKNHGRLRRNEQKHTFNEANLPQGQYSN